MIKTLIPVYTVLAGCGVLLNLLPLFPGVGLIKMLPAGLLFGVALKHTRTGFGYWVSLGIFCGMWGDFCLASLDKNWFMPGLVAFLLGHGFYIAAFRKNLSFTPPKIAGTAVLAAIVVLLLWQMTARLSVTGQRDLIAPGILYAVVLAAMAVICIGHRSVTTRIASGAVIFIISDAHIAANHLFLTEPWLPVTLSGYATYYLAQFLIVWGAVTESREQLVPSAGREAA